MVAPHHDQVQTERPSGSGGPGGHRENSVRDSPELVSAVEQLGKALDVELTPEILRRALAEARGIEALGAAMAALAEPISPELARSVQAEENWWRRIETEHETLSSTETAELLGKKSNRAYASHQRQEGRLLGYRRGNSYRYPKFQFDLRRRTVLPVIEDLLRVSGDYGVVGADIVLWLCTPSAYFDEQDEPVNHLHDHEAMIQAAQSRFGASW